MTDYRMDAEPGEYKLTGGTITTNTSGSAVVPEYNPSFYKNIANYYSINKGNADELKEFTEQIRKFYIDQMKKEADMDVETYRSQKRYGFWIFIIVLVLVVSGIAFSIVQFLNALKYGNYSQLMTTLEIQKAGNLVLTSSLVGAFVLTVSILFFFLFLQYVYKPNNSTKDFYKIIKDMNFLMKDKD